MLFAYCWRLKIFFICDDMRQLYSMLVIVFRCEEYDSLVAEMGQLKETLSTMTSSAENTKEMETKCNSLTQNMKKLQVTV